MVAAVISEIIAFTSTWAAGMVKVQVLPVPFVIVKPSITGMLDARRGACISLKEA